MIAGILGGLVTLFIFAIMIVGFVFWIKMIIDCAKREFENSNEKIVWILVVVLLQVLGAIVYWAVVVNKKK